MNKQYTNEKIVFYNKSEQFAKKYLSEILEINSVEDAEKILKSLKNQNLPKNIFCEHVSYSGTGNNGYLCLMTLIKNISINISELTLHIISFLLGITPFGSLISAIYLPINIKKTINCLTETEAALYIYLKELNKLGIEEFTINDLINSFVSTDIYTTVFRTKQDLLDDLECLHKKDLIYIDISKNIMHIKK